jgi:hypothetical protein
MNSFKSVVMLEKAYKNIENVLALRKVLDRTGGHREPT